MGFRSSRATTDPCLDTTTKEGILRLPRLLQRWRALGVATAVAVLTAASATAAAPASAAHVTFGPHSFHGSTFKEIKYDSNWGGYAASGSGLTSISGSWTMPSVTCESYDDLFAPWIGLDGYGDSTVEQTGVQVDCSSGSPVYSAWYEMYPYNPVYFNDTVEAGDSISASVVNTSGDNYRLTITDNTRGWTESTNQSLSGDDASAEAVIESPPSAYPDFSSVTFTNLVVNGQSFDNYDPAGMCSGGYCPGSLSNGSFSMTYTGG
jgi:hypothetical protein